MKKLLAILFVFAACNNSENENKPVAQVEVVDSAAHAAIVAGNDSLLLQQKTPEWLNKNLQLQGIDWKNVQLENFWNEDTFDIQPFEPESNFYKDYASVLFWSPDSTYVLDIGSYGSVVVTDGKGNKTLEAGDPDTEIAVILPKQKQRARLMFAGPSANVINAQWLDKSQATILGTFDQQDNIKKDTLLWMIDVKDRFFRLYNIKQQR